MGQTNHLWASLICPLSPESIPLSDASVMSSRLTSFLENKQKESGITLPWDSLCHVLIANLGGENKYFK